MISRACIKRSISARPASALGRAPSPPSQFQGYGHPSSCGTTLSRHLMASSPLETRSTGTVLSTSLCARWVLRRTAVRLFVSVSGRLFDNRVLCCIWAGPRTRWAQDASKPMLLPSLRDALLASQTRPDTFVSSCSCRPSGGARFRTCSNVSGQCAVVRQPCAVLYLGWTADTMGAGCQQADAAAQPA